MFKCKYCGKEFEKSSQLGGHIIWCKKNPNRSGKSNFNNKKYKNGIRPQDVIRDDLFCQYCGKQCKNMNSLKQHEIRCKENPDRLPIKGNTIGGGGGGFREHNNRIKNGEITVWNKGLTKDTNDSLKRAGETLKKRWEIYGNPNKGKSMSDEQKKKISISRSKFLKENPDKIPYLLNHSSKISYPEQYFIELFDRENIDLQYHKQVGLYQLDFYNEDKKLYLEIDGEQHYQEKSIERDEKRTQNLSSKGWELIMRIRWAEWKTYSEIEKKKVIKIIKDSLK